MVNTSISGTSPDGYRDVIGLPRLWLVSLAYRQADSQISKEKEITGIILTNGNKSSSFHSFLTHDTPIAYEVSFIKVAGIVDNKYLTYLQ